MPNVVNEMVVRELTEQLQGADGLLLFSMDGLTVAENDEFRGALAEGGVRARVVRGSLARLALAKTGVEFPDEAFDGSTAMAWGTPEHAVHAAKVLDRSPLKKEGKLTVKAGVLEGNVLDRQDADSLADLPDRATAQAMLLGVINGPARSLATVISAVPSGVARVLQAHSESADGGDGDES